ncbi:MAG: SDR family oxidoreductase [Nocardioides sp.]
MKSVKGKTVLITGAAMGMGKMFAQRAVAEDAARVVLWDINAELLAATAAELKRSGGNVVEYAVDVSDLDAIQAAAEKVRSEVGTIEVLFNNAGIVRGNAYFWETDSRRDTETTMKVNALAPMWVAREFLPAMIDSGKECRVVNLASAAGFVANPRMASYAGSKWAAIGWSDSVRVELDQAGHRQVKVTTVCPYYVKTGMFDGAKPSLLTPLLEPEDVVNTAWKAMLRGTPFVVMPKSVHLSELLKGTMPVQMRDLIAGRLFGVHKSMTDFKGR